MITKVAEILIKNMPSGQVLKHLVIKDLPPQKEQPGDVAYAAYSDKKPVGLLIHSPAPGDKFYGLNKKQLGHDVEVRLFWVAPEARGKGIGNKLLDKVISEHGHTYLGLGTGEKTTESARHMYRKNGFKVISSPGENKHWWLRKPTSH